MGCIDLCLFLGTELLVISQGTEQEREKVSNGRSQDIENRKVSAEPYGSNYPAEHCADKYFS